MLDKRLKDKAETKWVQQINNKVDNDLVRSKAYDMFKETNNDRIRKSEALLEELVADFKTFQNTIGVDLKGK